MRLITQQILLSLLAVACATISVRADDWTSVADDRHVHAWMDGDSARFALLDYTNEGAEKYFKATHVIPERPLSKGGTISGSVQFDLADRLSSP